MTTTPRSAGRLAAVVLAVCTGYVALSPSSCG
jgi:hypothetical protein